MTETTKSKYGILSSSADPQKLALTVRGILLAIIPTALIAARLFDVELAESDLTSAVSAIENVIISVGGVIAAGLTLWGVARKIALRIRK